MKELWTTILETLGLAWWVEVTTESPHCTYYFGPFASSQDAESETGGYIEDLNEEGAQGVRAAVLRCKPNNLTICDENADLSCRQASMPILSGQL
jgi:hypothetical protein